MSNKTGSLAEDLQRHVDDPDKTTTAPTRSHQHHADDPDKTIKALRKELQSWENAMEAARTTITYLEQRGAEKQKRIRELEHQLTLLERKA
jgi:peptidoglycan hydrolase CwlO-like protein